MSIQASVGYPGKGMTMQTDVSASDQAQSIIIGSVIKHVLSEIDCIERYIFNSEKVGADRIQCRAVADYVLDRVNTFVVQSRVAYRSSLERVHSVLTTVSELIQRASMDFYDEHFLLIFRYCRSEINALLGVAND
ncbi:MAG: hypothetical protein M8364_18425 [Methylobacter sp.]|uniref:hypothetical protein n=1 Tax=Methylobacter sp. TaxID=2051955 RepID=UPI00258D145D|nr:hypothetical protein [Methylobacter sp.]MCL7422870.1 hypothetical protein [Methylobacter sp.]